MSSQVGARDRASVPTTIVVPLDGTALSEMSVPLAYLLAGRFRANVRTVTVGGDGHDVAADLVLDGDPVEALLDHLAGCDGTLVCLSSHGHGGIRRRLIGSVAEGLIRRAPTPVIVTGPQVSRADVGVPRTLLAGFVGEDRSGLVSLLASWAPLLGARVELADVDRGSTAELAVTATTGQLPPDRTVAARPVAGLDTDGGPVGPHLLPGTDPIAGLQALADRLPPPVLVAVDGRFLDESVPGDLAYQLIRTSRWPVLATLGS